MADNVVIKDGNDVLATIATEDISGREFQLLKVGFGEAGTFNQITSASRLPVDVLFNNVQEVSGSVSAFLINQIEPLSSVSIDNFPTTTSAYILNQEFPEQISAVSITNFPTITSAYIINQSSETSSVNILNFPLIQEVSGNISTGLLQGITNDQLRSSAINVNIINQNPIVSSVEISNFPLSTSSYILNQEFPEQISAVSITNFPLIQEVSGNVSAFIVNHSPEISSVEVSNFPTTTSAYILNQEFPEQISAVNILNLPLVQEVSGNVSAFIINQSPVISSVDVSNFPEQVSAVSITNLPLVQETSPTANLANYWPAMTSIETEPVKLNVDPSGALQVRGTITSDEGSYSTDFTGNSIYIVLSGSCIFENGSITVSGIGTKFLKEVSYGDFIKLDSDSLINYTRIVSIISDTEVELEYAYQGSSNTGVGYLAGFEQIVGGDSSIVVLNSKLVLDSGVSATNLVQVSRVVDFLPTAAILRGFSISQNIPQVDPYFGFFDSDNVRNSNIACFINFTTFKSAQLITRTSLNVYDTNVVGFNLPEGSTVDIPARWRLEVTDDKVSVYYNDVLMATSFNHLPPIYKSLNFNIGINSLQAPPKSTKLYCDEVLFKNVDVVNTASSLLTHVQTSYDPIAADLLKELASVLNSLQATLKSYASIMGMSVDINGRQRTNIETGTVTASIAAAQTLATVTSVGTVSTITNQGSIGGYSANDIVPSNLNNSAMLNRQNISVS